MILALEASHVALEEERKREWMVLNAVHDAWNHGDLSDGRILARFMLLQSTDGQINFSGWEVLVEEYHMGLHVLVVMCLGDLRQKRVQMVFEELS